MRAIPWRLIDTWPHFTRTRTYVKSDLLGRLPPRKHAREFPEEGHKVQHAACWSPRLEDVMRGDRT